MHRDWPRAWNVLGHDRRNLDYPVSILHGGFEFLVMIAYKGGPMPMDWLPEAKPASPGQSKPCGPTWRDVSSCWDVLRLAL